jgi:hypothetical protein
MPTKCRLFIPLYGSIQINTPYLVVTDGEIQISEDETGGDPETHRSLSKHRSCLSAAKILRSIKIGPENLFSNRGHNALFSCNGPAVMF